MSTTAAVTVTTRVLTPSPRLNELGGWLSFHPQYWVHVRRCIFRTAKQKRDVGQVVDRNLGFRVSVPIGAKAVTDVTGLPYFSPIFCCFSSFNSTLELPSTCSKS